MYRHPTADHCIIREVQLLNSRNTLMGKADPGIPLSVSDFKAFLRRHSRYAENEPLSPSLTRVIPLNDPCCENRIQASTTLRSILEDRVESTVIRPSTTRRTRR